MVHGPPAGLPAFRDKRRNRRGFVRKFVKQGLLLMYSNYERSSSNPDCRRAILRLLPDVTAPFLYFIRSVSKREANDDGLMFSERKTFHSFQPPLP